MSRAEGAPKGQGEMGAVVVGVKRILTGVGELVVLLGSLSVQELDLQKGVACQSVQGHPQEQQDAAEVQ